MFDKHTIQSDYPILIEQTKQLLEPGLMITNMANIASLLYHSLNDVNWVGFYLVDKERLILGPFHGMPACTIIPFTQGVCGKAARTKQTVLVDDVHQFPGHIACDSASNAEIVVPVFYADRLVAVLDIDAPIKNRFTQDDQINLEVIASLIGGTYE